MNWFSGRNFVTLEIQCNQIAMCSEPQSYISTVLNPQQWILILSARERVEFNETYVERMLAPVTRKWTCHMPRVSDPDLSDESGSFGRIRIFRSNPDLSVKSDWWKRTFSVFLVVGSRSSFSNTWISINHVLTDQNSNNSKNIAWTFFPWPIKYYFKLTYKILASHLNDGFVNFLCKYL